MSKRHEAIGLKQVVRIEWMQKSADLLLAGVDVKSIRQELHEFLSDRKGNGSQGERGSESRTQVVNMLMNIWASPGGELVSFRDASLEILRRQPSMGVPVHWAMMSATYPFWSNVARQAGRLLSLQDQVTQTQIVSRVKEQYGDRQTVSRYARYVIRSFVAWGVLKDSIAKGCYEKAQPMNITDPEVKVLLVESSLLATADGKSALASVLTSPSLFPFHVHIISGDQVSRHSDRINVMRYGLDEELVSLRF